MFGAYARIILLIADFFGISKATLSVAWLVLSTLLFMIPSHDVTVPSVIFGAILSAPIILIWLPLVDRALRQEESSCSAATLGLFMLPGFRAAMVLLFLVFKFAYLDYGDEHWIFWVCIRIVCPKFFWIYFFGYPGLRSKIRLRDMINSLAAKLREVSTPSPVPETASG